VTGLGPFSRSCVDSRSILRGFFARFSKAGSTFKLFVAWILRGSRSILRGSSVDFATGLARVILIIYIIYSLNFIHCASYSMRAKRALRSSKSIPSIFTVPQVTRPAGVGIGRAPDCA
jgi:hypothetical protein